MEFVKGKREKEKINAFAAGSSGRVERQEREGMVQSEVIERRGWSRLTPMAHMFCE